MKFLLDQNLSPRLITLLAQRYKEISHVREHGLERASDEEV